MSLWQLFSGLATSAVVISAMPLSVQAQVPASTADGSLVAQAPSTDVVTDLESQPDTLEDLAVENLTNEQTTQIISIFDTYRPQINAATADYLEKLSVLNDVLVPQVSDLALTNARNDVVGAEQMIDDLVFQRNLAIRSVLTQNQRQVINDYLRAWLGIGPADPVAAFPQTLVGIEADRVLNDLQADGWEVVVRTPSLISLDRDGQSLDLDVARGQIQAAELRD